MAVDERLSNYFKLRQDASDFWMSILFSLNEGKPLMIPCFTFWIVGAVILQHGAP